MYVPRTLSGYIVSAIIIPGAIVVALLAASVFDIPLGPISRDQFPRHQAQAIAEPSGSKVAATTNVNRSGKSDRLPLMRADPAPNTKIIQKNVVAPKHTVQDAGGILERQRTLEKIDDRKHPPQSLHLHRCSTAKQSRARSPIQS